jgi:hypothetical protein
MRIGIVGLAAMLAATLAACGGGDSDSDATPTTITRIVVDPTQADYVAALPGEDVVRTSFRRQLARQEPKPIKDPGLPSLCGKKAPAPRAVAGTKWNSRRRATC